MIIKRENIFREKRIISTHLAKTQKAIYDKDYYCDTADISYHNSFDLLSAEDRNVSFKKIIIGGNHGKLTTYPDTISYLLSKTFAHQKINNLYLTAHLKTNLFYTGGSLSSELNNAVEQLKKVLQSDFCDEAVSITHENLNVVVNFLFWSAYCCAGPEYIFLFDKSESTGIHFSKYGNIHLYKYSENILPESKLTELGWDVVEGKEEDRF